MQLNGATVVLRLMSYDVAILKYKLLDCCTQLQRVCVLSPRSLRCERHRRSSFANRCASARSAAETEQQHNGA